METKIKGVYVAGDVRPKNLRQIVTAVSDGAIAATQAEKYVLSEKERLGIVDTNDDEVNNTSIKNNDLGNINRKSSLLNDDLRKQLKGVFSKLTKDVTIVTFVDRNNSKSVELESFILDIEELSDKIHLKVYNVNENKELEEKYNIIDTPICLLLNSENNYTGVKFRGVPGGHELNSFVLAIYNIGSEGQPISDDLKTKIKEINKKVNLKICIGLSCHLCPDVVVASQRMAILNNNIEAEMIDVALFKDIKDKYNIMSVPALIIDDKEVVFGNKKPEEIIEIITH